MAGSSSHAAAGSSGGGHGSDNDGEERGGDGDEGGMPAVTFKMLMRRGGKDDRTRELHVSA
jgi:hypothetical protein